MQIDNQLKTRLTRQEEQVLRQIAELAERGWPVPGVGDVRIASIELVERTAGGSRDEVCIAFAAMGPNRLVIPRGVLGAVDGTRSAAAVKKTATASWVLFLAAIVVNGVLGQLGMKVPVELFAVALSLTGLVCAFIALIALRRLRGARGILAPALLGLALNGLLLLIFVSNVMSAYSRAAS